MNWRTIQRLESEKGFPASRTKSLLKIRHVLEDAGVIFIDENGGGAGVRLKDRVSGQYLCLVGTILRRARRRVADLGVD
jgi:hypothetical protein